MTNKSFEDFRVAQADGQEWKITYDSGLQRTTSLTWIAYRALEDDDASVEKL